MSTGVAGPKDLNPSFLGYAKFKKIKMDPLPPLQY